MKVHNIIYFTDNYIYLKYYKTKNIIKYKLGKNIITCGKITNSQKFVKAYESLLKEYSLNKSLFGETIKIIVNPGYTSTDINLLRNIFSYFNYRKLTIENETKYYTLNSTNAYLNVYDSYQILTILDEYKKVRSIIIPSYFFYQVDDLMKFIKYRIKNRDLYLLGSGDILNDIFNDFENSHGNKTYIFSENEIYLISKAKQ